MGLAKKKVVLPSDRPLLGRCAKLDTNAVMPGRQPLI